MKRILLAGVVISSVAAYSQTASPEVISTAGNHFDNGTIQVSWTMGEPIIQTLSNGTTEVTQGFHQTNLSAVSVMDIEAWIAFDAFPNPVINSLTVEVDQDAMGLDLTLIAPDGRIAFTQKINEMSQTIDFTEYASGTYFLNLSKEGKMIKTFKIQKTH